MSTEHLSNHEDQEQKLSVVKKDTCYDIFKPFRNQFRLDKLSISSIVEIITKIE
ncbi:MAG: hypothetical protein ACW981_11580 [Candidatus Hodarchaeales archaeon]